MELLTELKQESKFLTISVAYLGTKFVEELATKLNGEIDVVRFDGLSSLEKHVKLQSILTIPDILILEVEDDFNDIKAFLKDLRKNTVTRAISVIILGFKSNRSALMEAFSNDVNDIYLYPFNISHIEERLKYICKFKLLGDRPKLASNRTATKEYRLPFTKRLFDIFVSGILLLLLLPFMGLIALLIKLDSKGPVIYKSKRAGTGYRIFSFYKFRSMRVDADKELANLASMNQYGGEGENTAFVKIRRDPRITKFGAFLRNTSIDEIPQLFNVLRGDMSLVGNRPLPLYEAQMLTSDEWAMRFLGPAGITGLWQVSKRGKSEMSDEERRQLDNQYAKYHSFLMDLKIILKTIPALIQSEQV